MWTSDLTMMMLEGIRDTLLMTLMSTLFGYLFGLPMGIALAVTDKTGIRPNAVVYKVLDVIVNIVRSVPFLILLILVMPLTRAIVGKTTGSVATIVPLTLAAAPFIGRMIESSLKEVDHGVIEAAQSMGASNLTIIWKVLLVEARTSILVGVTIAIGTILGYSAMAGVVGGKIFLPSHTTPLIRSANLSGSQRYPFFCKSLSIFSSLVQEVSGNLLRFVICG